MDDCPQTTPLTPSAWLVCLGIGGWLASESPAGFDRNHRLVCVGTRNLSALVLVVVQKYAVAARRGGSPLDLDIEQSVVGLWDRLAVEQAVENLLSNALKFGAGKPVTVRLRSGEGSACLEVQDRGIGMLADQQARIFGRFEQAVTQHRGSGYGVGLWVANRLVRAMDGRIAVSSRVGEGSTFTITLPLSPSEPE
ncbi:MAG TPA: HAMP domain-containing sensor histidine kinase, partial [Mycobacterium sp.]